ncbi:wax ester/triacylglycerol synthase family O-acyltransferase [Williamsia sterculiae]|uniref:Diacylglycerol O-acyltransferase n=1 Tax=Williamsia sterculiae TaxID=1344003 RepID=A0A1N7GT86_9NOCA|nr:wax ester/triacylglycerol synthase family O-acyltransferase [Williamsia sterculiae]SIS15760.1 acyltransferase, WS/DGAT/MGAT [Williamsia sterculiae]
MPVVTRLSAQDAALYYLDESGASCQIGSLLILDRETAEQDSAGTATGGLDYQQLLRTVEERLQLIPRYRQRIREVAFGLGRPVWVDDSDFDITYHVRRSALPSPGADDQLHDLIARLMSRPLDRRRPLWEMYLVEGLADNRIAVLSKTHQAMIDGAESLEINQAIVDDTRRPTPMPEDLWLPTRVSGDTELVVGAVTEFLARPWEVVDSMRAASGRVSVLGSVVAGGLRRVGAVLQLATDGAPDSPLNGSTTSTRRFTVGSFPLEKCRVIAERQGCSVNDVVLAVLAGALRRWLLSRSQVVEASTTVRAMVPLSAYADDLDRVAVTNDTEWTAAGLAGFVTDLPVGEPNATVRLAQIAHLTDRHAHSMRRAAGGRTWVVEMSPATFHAMSSRAAATMSRRRFNLPISIARGPRTAQYVHGTEILAIYPVPAVVRQRGLSIGLTSYNGRVLVAFNADRDVMWDLGVMPDFLTESFDELSTRSAR